jgi:hypothetical protein
MTKIHVTLPDVERVPSTRPDHCPGCGHWQVHRHGVLPKPLRDQVITEVTVHRYRCVRCGQTFRHYPAGVTRADHSQRLTGLLALCWALGLSLRRSELLLNLVGLSTSYLSVWRAVQVIGQALRHQPRGLVAVLGVDGTGIRLAGATRGLVVSVDLGNGALLELWLGDERDPARWWRGYGLWWSSMVSRCWSVMIWAAIRWRLSSWDWSGRDAGFTWRAGLDAGCMNERLDWDRSIVRCCSGCARFWIGWRWMVIDSCSSCGSHCARSRIHGMVPARPMSGSGGCWDG